MTILPLFEPVLPTDDTTVYIEKLVSGGFGLCRTPQVRLLPFAVPGDHGQLHYIDKTHAQWTALTTPSPARINAPCEQFGQCGGCQWQMLPIDIQRYWKQAIVAENMARIGKLPLPLPILPVLGTEAYHSRHHIKCQVVTSDSHHLVLQLVGLNPSDRVTPAPCGLIPNAIQHAMRSLQQTAWPSSVPVPQTIQLRMGKGIHVLVHSQANLQNADVNQFQAWCDDLKKIIPSLQGVHAAAPDEVHYTTLWGENYEQHTVGPHTYQVSPTSFFQVNPQGTMHLIQTVQQWAKSASTLLDAYSGVGLFSAVLADRFTAITAVEAHPMAHQNAIQNTPPHAHCLNMPMETFCQKTDGTWDVAIVDPPRAGLPKPVVEWLASHVNQRIILVGCDVAATARDTSRLVSSGWQLMTVQPIDMFPQTHHVETIVILDRVA